MGTMTSAPSRPTASRVLSASAPSGPTACSRAPTRRSSMSSRPAPTTSPTVSRTRTATGTTTLAAPAARLAPTRARTSAPSASSTRSAPGSGNNNRGNNVLTHTEVDSTGDPVHLGDGYENPAHSSVAQAPYTHTWSENMNLMAEQATTSSVNGWVVGAVGSAVTGLALLGYSLRKSAAPVATSVPV